ncbi:TonB-dependent receptor plug [Sphingobium chlorophenolicum L-1]|uniref:TonB-dependent receptor plug n=1 Tax=Sphingobium chlorophenolicum L-1 TaxID=690566 RepID=F6ET41_SPHCR|nr:TonB-dependent receptor [Sphingobium chlorophenolicum]AEG50415.1 TonB-dependent receptor plug [Sphingobium chlorophenolicum L-1]
MRKFAATFLASSFLATAFSPAHAQDQNMAGQDESVAPEIVVTAQKRVERLQDVPLAVTAVSGDALNRQQINDTASLTKAVPSLSFQPGATANGSGFRIRGVGTQLFSLGVEASVSLVVDGVVAARQTQSFADIADLERIEVLRGPQGTLFGKNATAGVTSIVTARPKDNFEGSVEATVAEQDEYRIKGTITGPLTDTLKARVSGYYNNVGGYVRNLFDGHDVNKLESWGVRGKLDWDATSNLNFLLSADYRKSDTDCCNPIFVRVGTPNIATLTTPIMPGRGNRTINQNAVNYNNDRQSTVSLEANLDLGAASITSISAWQKYKNIANNPADQFGFTSPVYLPGFPISQFDLNGGTINLEQWSQELRIGSNGNRDFTYVAGLFYSNVSVDRAFNRRAGRCLSGVILGENCSAPSYLSASSFAHNKSESIAAFSQVEYRVAGGLKLLGGLRVQHESTSVYGIKVAPLFTGDGAFVAPMEGKRSASDTAVTGKAGVKYEFSRNAQVYGSYTRGYKGLGFNTEMATNFATQDPVQPEHVDAYEIGFKGRTADGILTFAMAAFLADYSDLQILANRSDPVSGVLSNVQTNAGASRTKGIEIEATIQPSPSFSLNVGLTFADTSVSVDGLNCPLQFQGSAPVLTGNFPVNQCYRSQLPNAAGQLITSGPIQDVRGGILPYSPKWRLNFSPRYEHEIPGVDLVGFVQANINYQSEQHYAIEQDPLLTQSGYTLVDMSLGVQDIEKRYTATLFVKNLFNQHYLSALAHTFVYATSATPNDLLGYINKDSNRYFGATFALKF